ncbi:MAG: DNA-binding protein [Patescibacteria group bacterium]
MPALFINNRVGSGRNKPFLLRIDAGTLAALQHWANDELRSLNGQIEWILRDALRRRGRLESPKRKSDG